MEFALRSRHGAYPVEVTIDEDNYRFTVRNVDRTGAFFNSPDELVSWIVHNWQKEDFENPGDFEAMLSAIGSYLGRDDLTISG
ncbi:MAG: hypothetical protein BSOLF_1206 [Candidatus Carbobacillus altaicus]|uniref:Threonine dehydratase n=1 Tax=Candidatus Carbonibacillus altaicus TaxID=2163959 RepID=A0A2R6Y4T0_9BACL|nr:MAG: hypothetical protein BSOLF_1206 [Candidatus Carbobacillus altaicus]